MLRPSFDGFLSGISRRFYYNKKISKSQLKSTAILPPAARGLFLKKPPPGPPQKLFIKTI
jgi:hypothetical protein